MKIIGENTIIPLELSQELTRLKKLIENLPEIRDDELLELKTQFLKAQYKVQADQIAEKIILHNAQILSTNVENNYLFVS